MACFGDQVENVRALLSFMHGNNKGRPERGEALETSKEIMIKWNTPVAVRAGEVGIYSCLTRFKLS